MSDHDPEDIRKAYEATVNYHNTLVQMRFAVASFFAAAAAFLVGAAFTESSWLPSKKIISLLGLAVTLIVWLLEIRTYCLLRNLAKIGLGYEAKFKLGGEIGFFSLMSTDQPIGIRIPLFRKDLPNSKFVRRVFSHSFGLDCFYLCFVVFWISTLVVGKEVDNGSTLRSPSFQRAEVIIGVPTRPVDLSANRPELCHCVAMSRDRFLRDTMENEDKSAYRGGKTPNFKK